MTPAVVRRLLSSLGLRARKSLGQHFLTERAVLEKIVAAADLSLQDTVIEVGAGLGVLTRELARRAGLVIAVEIDHRLASFLSRDLALLTNVRIVTADILKTSPAVLLYPSPPPQPDDKRVEHEHRTPPYKVVANLPFYITSPILRHFLETFPQPTTMVVTVQEEVGEAIVAQPGKMSLLAVSIQFYARPCLVARVPAGSFYPSPKVDSVVLRLELRPQPALNAPDVARFFTVVRAGFSAPRKQLGNSLAQGLDLPSREIAPLLRQAGIDPRRRAETLSLEEWAEICRTLLTPGQLQQVTPGLPPPEPCSPARRRRGTFRRW